MKASLTLSASIRTKATDELLRTISLQTIKHELVNLFEDRTKADVSLFGRLKDNYDKWKIYNDCLQINDMQESEFNKRFSLESDNEDIMKHNVFIPFTDNGDAE